MTTLTLPAVQPGGKIGSIQALRGVAACMVALMHCVSAKGGLDHPTDKLLFAITRILCSFGGAGVDIFFVISGFIIMSIADRPTPGSRLRVAGKFLLRRALRIYPLYWITLLTLIATPVLIGYHVTNLYLVAKFRVWILATIRIPFQEPAWSLVFEVWFYFCTGLLLLLPYRYFRAAVAGWAGLQALLIVIHLLIGNWPGTPVLSSPQVMEFFLGCGVSCLMRLKQIGFPLSMFALAVAATLFIAGSLRCYDALPAGSLFSSERLMFYGVPAALTLVACVALERRSVIRPPAWMQNLGDWSYSIYLWHFPMLSVAFVTFSLGSPSSWPSLPRALLEFAATLLVASCSYRLIEQPFVALGHRLASPRIVHAAGE